MKRRDFFRKALGGLATAALLPFVPLPKSVRSSLEGFKFRISNTQTYAFGFTGFKPASDAIPEGRIMWMGNLQVINKHPIVKRQRA